MFGICIIAGIILSMLKVAGIIAMPWWSSDEISVLAFPLLSLIDLSILLIAVVLDAATNFLANLAGMRT
jgi:hypothetical protein